MVLAGFMGAFLDASLIYENIKLTILFSYIFLCFFLFKNIFDTNAIRLEKVFSVFFGFVLITAIAYLYNKDMYRDVVVNIWNTRSGGTFASSYDYLEGYRFSFIWTDPNNIAYMISAVFFFSLTFLNFSLVRNFFILIIVLVTLITSMSRGGALAFLVTSSFFLLFSAGKIKLNNKTNNKNKLTPIFFAVILLLFCAFLLFFGTDALTVIYDLDAFNESMDRLSSDDDTRLEKWISYLKIWGEGQIFFNIFTGWGAGSIIDGKSVSPHNGHFFWIMNYGFISYVILILFIFQINLNKGLKYYVWILPFLVGFSLNVMIGEAKLFVIYALMLSYANSKTNSINSNLSQKIFPPNNFNKQRQL